MSQEELSGTRELSYSEWHRRKHTARFLGLQRAERLSMVDIDSCEYCHLCGEPVALIETHKARRTKDANVTKRLARRAGIAAYTVAYMTHPTAVLERGNGLPSVPDITDFWVRELWPDPWPADQIMGPEDFAYWLEALRIEHRAKPGECVR